MSVRGLKICLAAGAGLALMAGAANAATAAHPDLSGMWDMHMQEYIKTDDGQLPPMKAAQKAEYDRKVARMRAGAQIPDSTTACLPHGMPRIMYTPFPVQILQRPEVVGMMFEVNHNQRLVYMNQKLPADPDPTYMGYSVGHWEGPVLVVETTGFNDKIQIDRAGLPQSYDAKIVERIRLINKGKGLEDHLTVTDPANYTAPWSYTVRYQKSDYKLMEYVCDNNRDAIRLHQ